MAIYKIVFTDVGLAKLSNAQVTQEKLNITHMAIGDANGTPYIPTGQEAALKNEVYRTTAIVKMSEDDANWIEVEGVIPADVGDFTINEFGLYDTDGDLVAISNYPSTPKPILTDGSVMDLIISSVIKSSNAELIELTLDPTVITASKDYVDNNLTEVDSRLTTQLAQNALLTASFPRLDTEIDDSPRLARAIDALPKGYKLILTEDVQVSTTIIFNNKEGCEFDGLNKTIKPLSNLLSLLTISNSPGFKITNGVTIDGSETARRGIEIIRSPLSVIEAGVKNIGNAEETETTCGVLVKEFSDFTIIRSVISKVYSKNVASGVWVSNFSETENPNAISKHVLVDNAHVSDIFPFEDSDGVKILNGNYNGDVNLIVRNSTFINCRKRGLKFQAKGCKSINNYFEFNEPSAYAAIDWQRGNGTSTNDTVIINIPSSYTTGHYYYTAFHTGGSNVFINSPTVRIVNENSNLTLQSRMLQVDKLVTEDIKNIRLVNGEFDGHNIEILHSIDGLVVTGNRFYSKGPRMLVISSNVTLSNVTWDKNEIIFTGSTSGDVLGDNFAPISGYVNQVLIDGTERYIRPKSRGPQIEWHIKLANTASTMNYDIVNDRCVTTVSSYPQTTSNSRFNALFNWCKVGDIAYKATPTTGSNSIGSFIADRWICTQAPNETDVRGLWTEVKTYI